MRILRLREQQKKFEFQEQKRVPIKETIFPCY